ncbi:DhnA family fructose-bisphosphate aldolase class Ia [Thermocatellispora tengchongensis]|uniref:DhnA family fructose-bisphosphate aldolase class Ia n=1 Tax=Thermocatellispora tengchongensis TaxID=1073253 RepID=A0A840P4J2_9ACTN|nr:fructose-bisphosphate aldolase [Thermocatellispora tengchongensis]MBB5130965.1 DhnA family fructose-bisphosphate aldolase class Ia [Thermocatellispora tengchongensis]
MQYTSAVGAGKLRRMRRMFGDDGRSVFVAIDHAAYMGEGPPLGEPMREIAAGRPDGVLATWHLARAYAGEFASSGLVLRVDGGSSELGDLPANDLNQIMYNAEQAARLGADCVVVLAFPGAPDEDKSLGRLARLVAECELLGLPVMAEMIPGGWARAVPWTAENVARAARIGAELGADIIKTVCPGPPEEFAKVVETCPVPVVALGGPKMDNEDQLVAVARGVVEAGGAGVAFGRNVWGSEKPRQLVERLREAVHGAASGAASGATR